MSTSDLTRRTRRPFEARPGRNAVVVDDLTELRGPSTGTVELPLHLFWQENRTFNLDDLNSLLWMYRTVLRETTSRDELRRLLDGPTLVRLWPNPRLFLPRGVRAAWETRHPQLRAAAAAA